MVEPSPLRQLMSARQPTLAEQVARFQLRRRASTDAFAAGVRLARQGGVRLLDVTTTSATAVVDDATPAAVTLNAVGHLIEGTCDDDVCRGRVCRHQVAVAHELWVRQRRR
ncbi:MAG TPA: hypothetical protein VFJ98_05310 [Mycobacteriales bacterium]|nr:hypothetical protein [Mycobacteriales bacterium]